MGSGYGLDMSDCVFDLSFKPPRTPKGYYAPGRVKSWPPCQALVAFIEGTGRIIETGGENIQTHVKYVGPLTEELGCGDPPSEGIWVFEGHLQGSGPDREGEYDSWWTGKWRTLNEEEKTEWKEFGYLEDLWTHTHVEFEDNIPCYHCGKARKEHLKAGVYDQHDFLRCPT